MNSELFDHTSLIRFLERRFGPREDNITPWRRAVAGDLTSTLDFRRPNRQRPPRLPDTDDFKPVRLRNPGHRRVPVAVHDRYGSRSLAAGESVTERWSLSRSRGWYDLTVTIAGDFRRRYAGHVETGETASPTR